MSIIMHRRCPILKLKSCTIINSAYCTSSENRIKTIKNPSLSQLKRGTGGRSSFNGIVCTVFGATGFLGRHVCNRLGKIGTQLIIPYHGEFYEANPLKIVGDLGQVLFHPYYLRDEESIRRAVKHSNVVINLVGKEWETRNFKFHDVHVEGAQRIARISKEMGVEKFVHVSSINASPNPKPLMLKGGSQFLKSKWAGEQAVLKEFPDAVIFRPADMWGEEDRFVRYYAYGGRTLFRKLHLWKCGRETIKQPVSVGNVAAGIVEAVKDPDIRGQIIQAVGPRRYVLHDLCTYMYKILRKDDEWRFGIWDSRFNPLWHAYLTYTSNAYYAIPLTKQTWDKHERECLTDTLEDGLLTLEDLGVKLVNFEDVAENLMEWLRLYAYDENASDDLPDSIAGIPPPPHLPYIDTQSVPVVKKKKFSLDL